MRCAAHPDVETELSCGKCGRPICPDCMVQTPVGIRCRDCARLKRLPTFSVSKRRYLIASGVGLAVAAAAGALWAVIAHVTLFFSILIPAAIGYAAGELISLTTNRSRGPWLQAIAGGSVAISFAIYILFAPSFSLFSLLGLGLGIFIAAARLR
jgi:hypothetical protein